MQLRLSVKGTLPLLVGFLLFALMSFTHANQVLAQLTLANTNWNVQSYNDGQGNQTAVVASQPMLFFGAVVNNFGVSGDTSCNRFNGSYTVTGSSITFGAIRTPPRACADPKLAAQEQAYLAALGNSTTYQLSSDQLVLSDASGSPQVILTPPFFTLAGATWRVSMINKGYQGTTPVFSDAIALTFGEDGVAVGSSACNDFRALYTSDAHSSLSFGTVSTTPRTCEERSANEDQFFLAALAAASTYTFSGNILTVRDAGGAIQFIADDPNRLPPTCATLRTVPLSSACP